MTKTLGIAARNLRVGLSVVGALALLGATVAMAQPHHDHDHYDDHHHGDGGIHAPHYHGVPPHASHVVGYHDDHRLVVFYSQYHHTHDHHGHRDYYCLHEGHSERIAFGTHAHVHDMAHGLMEFMRLADEDMLANYGGNRGFDVVHAEMHDKFIPCTERLDELADAGDYDAARAEFQHVVDNLNHLERDVRHWHRHHHRQVGRGGLLTKIGDMRSLVAHLSNDLGVHSHSGGHPH